MDSSASGGRGGARRTLTAKWGRSEVGMRAVALERWREINLRRRDDITFGWTPEELRGKIEKHIKNTYLKSVQAPVGVKPVLKAWMELS